MTDPLPILHIANFADRVGGGEESLLALVRGLDRCRFLLHAVVPGEGEMAIALRKEGLPVDIVRFPPIRPWTSVASLQALLRLRSLLVSCGIKLVHAHGSRSALYASLATCRSHIPVIWHVRVADPDPWLDGMLLYLASAVIANSRATAGRFVGRSCGAGKVHIIHNGVDLARFRPGAPDDGYRRALGIPSDGPVIGFAGRLEYGKGPDIFLEAALRVHKDFEGVTFLFVGNGPMRADLERRARAAGLPAVFAGHQPDLLPVLHLCAVVVVPSRQEAFGRVLIEAMATEVPIVATRVGGIPEVCTDGRTGLLVPPEDPLALAHAIMATLNEPEVTKSRVQAASEDVKSRFSLAAHAGLVSKLYLSLLEQQDRR